LAGKPERTDHPFFAYLVSGFVLAIVCVVLAGVFYNFAFSPRGPALLAPIKEKLLQEKRSVILEEAGHYQKMEMHRRFHHIVEIPLLQPEKRPACFICHSRYPHTKNRKIRSLMNMHTNFLVCETCHIKAREGAAIVHKWYNPFVENPSGPFYGTSYDAETGFLTETEDIFARIAPFYMILPADSALPDAVRAGNLETAILRQDASLAREYMQARDTLTPAQRESAKIRFHANIKPKGHVCHTCHSEKGILDFRSLGFTEKRAQDLEQLNITGLITKYEEFYLPDLLLEPPPPGPRR